MLTRCIFCHQTFATNDRFEHMPIGRRIAFDPARGRLWCICESCQSWTLAPFEQRWEAVEELELRARTRAKLLRQGENIALMRDGPVELVRIGKAGLREEAWWRYGDELARRQDNARKIVKRGKWIDAAIWMAIIGIPVWAFSDASAWIDKARAQSFGRFAWRGTAGCERCGRMIRAVGFRDRGFVRVLECETLALRLPCPNCSQRGRPVIQGAEAVHTLRRVLAYHNFAGASRADVDRAASRIESPGSLGRMAAGLTGGTGALAALDPTAALTLEIAMNDQHERDLLALELQALDARWKQEELIAAIVDGELTRLPSRPGG